jgi:DNA polymerase-3 subunit epsilon
MISRLLLSLWRRLVPRAAKIEGINSKVVSECQFVAIDLELTSLNPSTTSITSIGYVEGINGRVDLSMCGYSVINTSADLGQSPVIHGLTHDVLCRGKSLLDAMNALIPRIQDTVLVFHNANLDLSALDNAFKALELPEMEVVYIDTLKLAIYQLNKQHQILPSDSATLTVCRQRLDLPSFPEHNALDDALATLTLFYAQLTQLGVTQADTLNVLSHTKAVGRYRLGRV